MSTIQPNQVDGDMFTNLQMDNELQTTSSAVTPENAVIVKCMHPPSAVPDFCGLPTNDARSQALLEWRGMQLSRQPRTWNGTKVVPLGQSASIAYLIPASPRLQAITFCLDETGKWVQDIHGTVSNSNYDFDRFAYDSNKYRPIYKSSTVYLNATALSDTGMVTSCQFNPNVLFAGTIRDFSEQKYHVFASFIRTQAKSGRFKHRVKDEEDFTVIERFKKMGLREGFNRSTVQQIKIDTGYDLDQLNIDPDNLIQIMNFSDSVSDSASDLVPVPTASAILQNSIRSAGTKALEGCFVVQRLNTISPAWLSSGNTKFTENNIYECWTYWIDSSHQEHFVQLSEDGALGSTNAPAILRDVMWTTDMTWSWVRFDGLSYNTAVSAVDQILIYKWYVGIEVQPSMTSAWSAVSKLSPKPDLETMQLLMQRFYDLKDMLPARYNMLGSVFANLAQGVVEGGVKGIAGALGGRTEEKKVAEEEKEQAVQVLHKAAQKEAKAGEAAEAAKTENEAVKIERTVNKTRRELSLPNRRSRSGQRSKSRSNSKPRVITKIIYRDSSRGRSNSGNRKKKPKKKRYNKRNGSRSNRH